MSKLARRLAIGGFAGAGAGVGYLQWQSSQCSVVNASAAQKGQKVCVIGGGVMGVCTAHALVKAGFKVTLVEPGGIGDQCSLANACSLRTSSYVPLASPGAVKRLCWALITGDQIYQFRWLQLVDPAFAAWGLRFLGAAFTEEVRARGTLFLRDYSPLCIERIHDAAVAEGFGDQYEREKGGMLNVFTGSAASFQGAAKSADASRKDWGKQCFPVDAAGTVALEPSLAAVQDKIAGGVDAQDDEHGDCGKYSKLLWQACEKQGATLVAQRVKQLEVRTSSGGSSIDHVVLEDGTKLHADHFVLSAGSKSTELAAGAGVYLPIYPVKGYSLTVPCVEGGPVRSLLTFEPMQMYITTLGKNRVRFASIAEFAGQDMSISPSCVNEIKVRVKEMWPHVPFDWSKADVLVGARPMTPDDMPIISGTKHQNLFINSGQGSFGWRLAYLSADMLVAAMTKSTCSVPESVRSTFLLNRFQSMRATG